MTRSTSRPRGVRARSWLSFFAVLSVLVGASVLGAPASPALAKNYPSYADVLAARQSEASTQSEIATLQGLLTSLQAAVESTQALAVQKGAEAQAAQLKFDEAKEKAAKLTGQADTAQAEADKSREQAGQLAARLARSGGEDLDSTLFFNGSKASALLSELGLASMVKDQSAGLYARAIQSERTARSLTDQANVAKDALKRLADDAQNALDAAAEAASAAEVALAEQQAHQIELGAQLASLTAVTAQTESDYATGVELARQAAAALMATQLAAAPPAGQVASSGWTRPSAGHISSPYGWRVDPYNGIPALHEGTDLAPGCGSPIYAAHGGIVILAGPYGGYGNYIRIRNSDDGSYMTAYGHIVNGGILVHIGQTVQVGQNIARVGSTGWSTGCHLHFEVYHNGGTEDPVPFMRSQGVELAN